MSLARIRPWSPCNGKESNIHSLRDTLLEYLEDDILGQKIAETEDEELLDSSQAQAIYQEYLAEVRWPDSWVVKR